MFNKYNISIPKNVKNPYISYKVNPRLKNLNTNFTVNNCLFESLRRMKNVDLDKYKYSGYSIAFDSSSKFLFTDEILGKNVIIFGADISSSLYIDLDEEQTQGLQITVEAKYHINFPQSGKTFPLSLHYNGSKRFRNISIQSKGGPNKRLYSVFR